MNKIIKDLLETINPKRGHGLKETIIFITLIVAITFLIVHENQVPKEFLLSLGVIVGYITGNKGKVDDDE